MKHIVHIYRADLFYANINIDKFSYTKRENFHRFSEWMDINFKGFQFDKDFKMRTDT